MKVNSQVRSRVSEDGVILIEGLHSHRLAVVGCSLPCSVSPGSANWVDQVAIVAPKGKTGILALRVFAKEGHGKQSSAEGYSFILKIEATGDTPAINLDEVMIPTPDRLIQMGEYGYLEVRIGDELFTTRRIEHAFDGPRPNTYYDVDGNLICRYAVGEIDADEFRQQIKSWREQKTLRQAYDELSATHRTVLDESATERAQLLRDVEDRERELDRVRTELENLGRERRENDIVAALVYDLDTYKCERVRCTPSRLFPTLNRHRRFGMQLEEMLRSTVYQERHLATAPPAPPDNDASPDDVVAGS